MNGEFSQERPHFIPSLIAGAILLAALGDWPYGYYIFLRFVVCGVSIYIAIMAYEWKRSWVSWIFGAIAILFNPIIPIHLTREIWQRIDIGCAILFMITGSILKKGEEK